jgi:hypothetical protein
MQDNKYTIKRRENILKGEYRTGSAPWGYRFNKNSVIEPDPDKYPYIKILFEAYTTQLYSYKTLSEWLTQAHGVWIAKNTLAGTLSNPFYYGYQRYNNKFYKHIYPVAISKELFVKVQNIILECGTRQVKKTVKPFLYRNLIKCGSCGYKLAPHEKRNEVNKYYTCIKKTKKITCKNRIKEEELTIHFKNLFYSILKELYILFAQSGIYHKKLICDFLFDKLEFNFDENSIDYSVSYNLKPKHVLEDIHILIYNDSSEVIDISSVIHEFKDPILQLCITPQFIEDIATTLNLPLHEVQSRIMDLQLEDKIMETNIGKWITIK